ncbi:MAG TPA: cyclic pyranopterin monophosphate synthase MoaC [Polyangiales bacterium]|nr:cyclic pyranopterin monophosphate synthase MoaC [Polyangiales bacterium]
MASKKRARSAARARQLTHLDGRGQAQMVDVADKPVTAREAVAGVEVHMQPATLRLLQSGAAAKGDVLAVARVAGIQAAKRTPELIPLCHSIALSKCEVRFDAKPRLGVLSIQTRVRALDRTGAEMEALTAAAVAALTVYDMLKAVDRSMVIRELAVLEKRGGRSGDYVRPGRDPRR